jgi:predicted dehydrogenase
MIGETAPSAISAHGGKYVLDHDGDIPDTMQVTFEFASGAIIAFGIYEASSGALPAWGEVELRGTKGLVLASEKGYRIEPTRPGQFQKWEKQLEAEEFDFKAERLADGSNANSTAALIRNFLDCVKSRSTPLCTLEDGHRSTSFAHLANIALATNKRLEWDAQNEKFTNCEEANKLLHYEYRKPWKL